MRRLIGLSMIVALTAACGQEETPDFNNMRSGGKADGWVDTSLSCQGNCDSITTSPTGYCGCDELCATYGDCCDDKAQVCDGGMPADVIITEDDNSPRTIKVGQTVVVKLAGNPTTGYSWELPASNRSFPLQKKVYVPDETQMVGTGGTYHFYFTADTFHVYGGTFPLKFYYYRTWEDPSTAIRTFEVEITVESDKKTICEGIDASYKAEIAKSQDCVEDSECQTFVSGNLTCGIGLKAINNAFETNVKAFRTTYADQACYEVPWLCPQYSPLPPWYDTVGYCDAGKCQVKHVDTRAKEGENCGNDIDVQCGDGLYCAMGLNWCGTPPVVGQCRKYGDCGATSDCSNNSNYWDHIECVGQAECSANGKCSWNCNM